MRLCNPLGLHFDAITNSLIITNYCAKNIVCWILGATSWTLLGGSSTKIGGSLSTQLLQPRDVTINFMGNIYVTDTGNHRIPFFLAGQMNAATIAGVTNIVGTSAIH